MAPSADRLHRTVGARRRVVSHPGERQRFWLIVATLAICSLGGGSSWETSQSLLYLRPSLVLICAALLLLPPVSGSTALRWPALLLAAFAATIAVQLIPLPPTWWRALPGRTVYADAAALTGQAGLWRPISLSPDCTINSLLALLPAIAVLLASAGLSRRTLEDLVPVILVVAVASAVLGVVQWSGTGYLYQQASTGFPTGFFANRNHQAVFLSFAFPLLRVWLETARSRGALRPWQYYAAAGAALFLLTIIITTGSRAGLVATVLAIAVSWFVAPRARGRAPWTRPARRRAAAVVMMLALLLGALVFFGRAVSMSRLVDADNYTAELRVRFTPLLLDLVHQFGGIGSGFGTFDAVFRAAEPDWALKPTFFNRAHNEVLEVAITGGVAPLMVIAGLIGWIALRSIAAWRPGGGSAKALPRLGSAIALLLLLASLVDYPLRTPLLTALMALAVAWLTTSVRAAPAVRDEG